ncbi:MAG TPA: hypothetical protein VLD67_00975 [Vicinamibacterales bacterium]|nr:hypothetical protein [Vicinamibacterales bacterium]
MPEPGQTGEARSSRVHVHRCSSDAADDRRFQDRFRECAPIGEEARIGILEEDHSREGIARGNTGAEVGVVTDCTDTRHCSECDSMPSPAVRNGRSDKIRHPGLLALMTAALLIHALTGTPRDAQPLAQ